MKVLPATLGASNEHYRRLGLSRCQIELWEDGMRTGRVRAGRGLMGAHVLRARPAQLTCASLSGENFFVCVLYLCYESEAGA